MVAWDSAVVIEDLEDCHFSPSNDSKAFFASLSRFVSKIVFSFASYIARAALTCACTSVDCLLNHPR